MDEKLRAIITFAGLFTLLYGLVLQRWALAHHRAADSTGPWLGLPPRQWKAKREWFASEYGFRLYRNAAWHIVVGALIMLAARWL